MTRFAPRSSLSLQRAAVTLRRAAFLYFTSWVAGAQIVFALLVAGAPLPGRSTMTWIAFTLWPGSVAAVILARAPPAASPADPGPVLRWTAAGLAAYVYWAASYYFVAWAIDPARVRLLPELVEARIPFSPVWSLVYAGVHPFTLAPSLGLRDARLLRRHVVGQAAIVAISSLAWASFPVAVARVAMPSDPPELGAWVLASIYGRDPVVNCLPSTHCAMAVYTASALQRVDARLGVWAWATAAAIAVSTLFTKEHYLVDVIAGIALGGVAARFAHRSAERPRQTA